MQSDGVGSIQTIGRQCVNCNCLNNRMGCFELGESTLNGSGFLGAYEFRLMGVDCLELQEFHNESGLIGGGISPQLEVHCLEV